MNVHCTRRTILTFNVQKSDTKKNISSLKNVAQIGYGLALDLCFLSTQTQYGDCPRKKGCPIVGKSPSPSSTSVVQFFLGHMTLMERNSSKMLVLPYNICILKQG